MVNPYDRYTKFANEYTQSSFVVPKRILSRPEQQVITIHALLNDGEWHTAAEISQHIGLKSHRHVQNMMQALKEPLGIASGQQGYCIPNESTILIA
jgi:DNA-directed RNA polymerase sigma subunit (sigma70/sigma32)